MSTDPGPAPTDASFLNPTTGTILIGLMVTGCLFGVTSGQTAWYHLHYRQDRTFLRILVSIIYGLDTLSLLFYVWSMWQYLVDKELLVFDGKPLPWTSNAQLVCNAAAIATIQGFYTFRIWTLSKNKLLLSILAIFVAADFALGLLLFVKRQTESLEEFGALTAYDIALSATTTVTDVLLCGTLVTLLIKSRTGNAGSNRLIKKLLLYTIHTGAVTSLCSIMSLITVIVLPTTALYVMFYYIGSRMYTVSLLSTLNARQGLRTAAEHHYAPASLPRLTTVRSTRHSEDGRKRTVSEPHEIVVSIQRDTTVTFEEQDHKSREVYRKTSSYKARNPVTPVPLSDAISTTEN
ncbi:hypothetical protein C8Q76DRAFT_800747 [Earliella scabrosa]|nr:hypothetical protein C8Q76DRAFT_800747 [Earliella scabrosa]